MSRPLHVHTLARRLPPVRLGAHGVGRAPDLAVAEALIAARKDGCENCCDQLSALVLRGDPVVISHLIAQAWGLWRVSEEGQRPDSVMPISARSATVLRHMMRRDMQTMVDYLDEIGPADLIVLLDDALAVLVPHTDALPRGARQTPRSIA
ncbi:MAG TPA: hypothetical protein K8V84_16465 [Nocardiopsis listeri]|uniref:hypothetical protein n=1 Tax=Nocardiopsis listeri TaxID=53440 RepID=UPI001DB790A1|nr:hypothetical protein [Nocardiopsis listeri]HJE60078.1 hypothetical protein [Nocardiopsis listeri]